MVRPGKTFRRVANGNLEGLCGDKKVYVCTASSGKSKGTDMDHLRPYLDVIFAFIGIRRRQSISMRRVWHGGSRSGNGQSIRPLRVSTNILFHHVIPAKAGIQ